MRNLPRIAVITSGVVALSGFAGTRLGGPRTTTAIVTPANGHTIHVLAPHILHGKLMRQFHQY